MGMPKLGEDRVKQMKTASAANRAMEKMLSGLGYFGKEHNEVNAEYLSFCKFILSFDLLHSSQSQNCNNQL